MGRKGHRQHSKRMSMYGTWGVDETPPPRNRSRQKHDVQPQRRQYFTITWAYENLREAYPGLCRDYDEAAINRAIVKAKAYDEGSENVYPSDGDFSTRDCLLELARQNVLDCLRRDHERVKA